MSNRLRHKSSEDDESSLATKVRGRPFSAFASASGSLGIVGKMTGKDQELFMIRRKNVLLKIRLSYLVIKETS